MATKINLYGKADKLLNSTWPNKRPGNAYAFLRTNAVCGLGHIGWGFEVCDGQICFGGTENPENAELQQAGSMFGQINPAFKVATDVAVGLGSWHQGTTAQGGDNQSWIEIRYTVEMFMELRKMGYDLYKIIPVTNPSPAKAYAAAVNNLTCGFTGLTNNCVDATHRVLTGYGASMPAPWIPTNWAPLWYFDHSRGAKKSIP